VAPTILVVDDEATFRKVLCRALAASGYRTCEAADGEAAWQLARHTPPDLVLLDVAMPGAGGIPFLRRLRHDPALEATPVIIVTALRYSSMLHALNELRVAHVMLKTRFSLADLMRRVSDMLPGHPAPARHAAGG
jgi:CheY-like chemotaxis protein